MDENDIFKTLREIFFEYWEELFRENDIADVRSLLALQESGPQDHKSKDSNLDDENSTAITPLEIKNLLKLVHQIDDSSQLPEIKKPLNRLSEKLHVNKLKASADDQNSENIWKFVRLLTHDMFNIKVKKNCSFTVQWYAHLFVQTKFIASGNTKFYRKLLRAFHEYWERFIARSTNAERRYIRKLMAFVYHIDSRESEQEKDFIRAPADAKKAEKQYNKVRDWEFGWTKQTVLADIKEFLFRIENENHQEGKIGPAGGLLSMNGCSIEIAEGELKNISNIRIDPSVENPDIDEDVIPITPVMQCGGGSELNKVQATIKLEEFCTTENDTATASIWAKDTEHSKWVEREKKHIKGVRGGISFTTRFAHKFLVAVKKIFLRDAVYCLNTDIWYSSSGNFVAVCYVNTRAVSAEWDKRMVEDGYTRSEARINCLKVSGIDELFVKLKMQHSTKVVFRPEDVRKFKVEDIADHCQGFNTNFRLQMLPVGNEMAIFNCVVCRNDTEVENSTWNLQWPDQSRGKMYGTLDKEIIPSFKHCKDSTWRNFVRHALLLGDPHLKPPTLNDERTVTNHRKNILRVWWDGEKGSGKGRVELGKELECQKYIREKTIQYREEK